MGISGVGKSTRRKEKIEQKRPGNAPSPSSGGGRSPQKKKSFCSYLCESEKNAEGLSSTKRKGGADNASKCLTGCLQKKEKGGWGVCGGLGVGQKNKGGGGERVWGGGGWFGFGVGGGGVGGLGVEREVLGVCLGGGGGVLS